MKQKSIKSLITGLSLIILLGLIPGYSNAQKATKLFEKGQYEKAEQYCAKKKGVKQDNCYKELADAYFDKEDYVKAEEFYKKIGVTTLIVAIKRKKTEIAELLIKKGADINSKDNDGYSALMLALAYEQPENAKLLIEKGADINVKSTDDWTALMFALNNKQPVIAKLLIEKGADINIRNKDDWTPLELAENYNSLELIELLHEYGADINAMDSNGLTVLMLAAQKGKTKIVKLLIEEGADVNLIQNKGRTALMLAVNNTEIEVLLLKAGANPNIRNINDIPAFIFAFSNNYFGTAEVLLKAGVESGNKKYYKWDEIFTIEEFKKYTTLDHKAPFYKYKGSKYLKFADEQKSSEQYTIAGNVYKKASETYHELAIYYREKKNAQMGVNISMGVLAGLAGGTSYYTSNIDYKSQMKKAKINTKKCEKKANECFDKAAKNK